MAKLNKKSSEKKSKTTHEGAKASIITPEQELRRSVMASMLWENSFYEDGVTQAKRIAGLIDKCDPEVVRDIAIEARNNMKLRHIPLLITREMAKNDKTKRFVAETLNNVIKRADETTEFLAIYWMDGRQPLSNQVKKGLGKSIKRFDAYQLAKYNRKGPVKLKDVLKLTHPKPDSPEQEKMWKDLINDELKAPDTWEVKLSAGESKKDTFTRLLKEKKLGYMALLKNIRGMDEVGVSPTLIKDALKAGAGKGKILPFRFITAYNHAPTKYHAALEEAMLTMVNKEEKLPGKTILAVDTSGSMYHSKVSAKSEMTRMDGAAALAMLMKEVCEEVVIYDTAVSTKKVPDNIHGFKLATTLKNDTLGTGHGGIYLVKCMDTIHAEHPDATRVIVFTDEQDCGSDRSNAPAKANAFGDKNYLVNVATYENGIGYGDKWLHVHGFSESIVDYIKTYEKSF